jgi:hypothetical protein
LAELIFQSSSNLGGNIVVNKASAVFVACLGLAFLVVGVVVLAIFGTASGHFWAIWSIFLGTGFLSSACLVFGYCSGLGKPLKVVSLSEMGLGYVIQWQATHMSRCSTIYLLTPSGNQDIRPRLPVYVEQLL